MTPLRSLFTLTTRTAGLIYNLLLWGVYLLALLAPYVSPKISAIPSFCNLAFVPILFFFFFSGIVHLFRRNWGYLSVYFMLAIIGYGYTSTYLPMHCRSEEMPHELRVMSYNVRGFDWHKEKKDAAAAVIRNSEADVVCLQEAVLSTNEVKNNAALARLFAKIYPHRSVHYNYKNHSQGLVILSKYPIVNSFEIEYPSQGNASVAYLLRLKDNYTALIINNHMESYRITHNERKKYADALRTRAMKRVPELLSALHDRLGKPLRMRGEAADEVQTMMRQLRDKYKPHCIIVTGDMNDTPMSYTYGRMRSDLRDAFAEKGCGLSLSYQQGLFRFRIDHLFYSGNIEAVDAKIPSLPYSSDHNPIFVDFLYKQ